MARVRTRMPNIFVGHPFSGRFPTGRFRKVFRSLPFSVIYGNTNLETKHLLGIMKNNIAKSDFSIFDVSDWNPNVALELGIAEGLKKKAAKEYYILLNTRRSGEVPSDIRGLQRLEYTSYDFKPEVGLGNLLVKYILSKEFWIKKITKLLSGSRKAEKKQLMVLRIISHIRDHEKLTPDNIKSLIRGTRLRKEDRDEVLEIMRKHKLIRKIANTRAYRRGRKLFK